MNRIVIKLNEGGKYNSNKFPRCNARVAAGQGTEAVVRRKSKIGTGTGVGYAKPVVTTR